MERIAFEMEAKVITCVKTFQSPVLSASKCQQQKKMSLRPLKVFDICPFLYLISAYIACFVCFLHWLSRDPYLNFSFIKFKNKNAWTDNINNNSNGISSVFFISVKTNLNRQRFMANHYRWMNLIMNNGKGWITIY